jgi:aryl-alcohol dehydrogenase-like predicted oxidoreductase
MSTTLQRRPFGSTGEGVSIIGLGGAYLDKYSLADGVATVRRALELGINYFDTAPAYGRGASQVVMGKALEGCTEPYMLATKLGYLATPADFRSPDALRAQLWENLRALRRSEVDLLQVHLAEQACWWQDGARKNQLVDHHNDYDFAQAPVMQVLREAKARGVCRLLSITADHAREAAHVLRHVDVDACLVAYDYSLLSRQALRNAVPLARDKGVAYIAAGALKSIGADTGRSPDPRLKDLQKSSGLSLVSLGLRYLVADPDISTILVGAATPEELEECVTAVQDGPLPSDLQRGIDELGLPS